MEPCQFITKELSYSNMRIISGTFKGRKLPGKVPPNVRPTQDALRETIFNILSNYIDFEGKVVCDLCCGTGAMGLEAISRGARFAYFVDISKQSLSFVKSVCDSFKLSLDKYKTILFKAEKFLISNLLSENIDLIFADPPYADNIINDILLSVSSSKFTQKDTLISIECGANNSLIIPDNIEMITERKYTISKFILLRKIS